MARLTVRTLVGVALLLGLIAASAWARSPHPTDPRPLVSIAFQLTAPSPGTELTSPAVAFDGTNYLVVWSDYRPGGIDVLGVRVSSQGTVLEPGAFTIAGGAGSQESPDVAWDGQNYLVVWADGRSYPTERVHGALVTRDGTVLPRFPISAWFIGPLPSPSVAFNGTNYLVAWSYGEFSQSDVYANRVSRSGLRLDGTGFAVAATTQIEREADVATNGVDFLVAWQQSYAGGPYYMPYAGRVSAGGAVLDPTGIPLDMSPGDANGPSASFDGTRYLVVWSEGTADDVVASRVTPGGVVLDPQGFTVASSPAFLSGARTSWDGGVFETVWAESADSGAQPDLRGARVAGDATVLDPSGFDVSRAADREFGIDVASGTLGRTALAYIQSPEVGGPRHLALRFLDRGPVPSTLLVQPGDWFAFLYGYVHPNTQTTNVWFEWGRTEALGNVTPVQVVGTPGTVRADVYGLDPGTAYYFRVVAENASGRGQGETRRFGTLTTPPPYIPPPPQPPPPPPPPPPGGPPIPRYCRVPGVVGRTLRVARSRIVRAGCRVGRVRRARSRRRAGIVLYQLPRARAPVRLGSRVNLLVSRGRR